MSMSTAFQAISMDGLDSGSTFGATGYEPFGCSGFQPQLLKPLKLKPKATSEGPASLEGR